MHKQEIIAWAKAKMLDISHHPLEDGYRYYHGERVARLSLRLAEALALPVNKDVLFIGALLHDVGKVGYSGPDHGPRGAQIIELEIPHLLTQEELAQVTNIVSNHYERPRSKYWRGRPDPGFPSEILIVQDADTLDHHGGNGIWIAHHWHTLERVSQAEAIHRYRVVDAEWRRESWEAMNYAISRRELEYRLKLMDAFFARWERETAGELTHLMDNE